MPIWETTLGWVLALVFGLLALLGLTALISGEIIEGQVVSSIMSGGLFVCSGLLLPPLWRRARTRRSLVLRYGAVILIFAGLMVTPMRVTQMVRLPAAASQPRH